MRGRNLCITAAMFVALPLTLAGCGDSKPTPTATTCPAGNAKPARAVAWGSIYANVYNASSTNGRAAQIATQLQWRGLHTLDVKNDPLNQDRPAPTYAEIRYGSAGKTIALNVAEQIPHAKLVQDERSDPTIDVVIGNKFSLLPRPVSAPKDVHVIVYNTTVVPSLAGTAQKALKSQGYQASTHDNDGSYYPDDEAVVVYNDEGLPQAQRLAMNFRNVRLVKAADAPHATVKGTDVHLYLGSKWPVNSAAVLPAAQATHVPAGAVVKPAC